MTLMPPIPLSTWSSNQSQSFPARDGLIMSCGEMISGIILSINCVPVGYRLAFDRGTVGLVTDGKHGNAHVLYETKRILQCLEAGLVPVVAGFQGMGENGELTTLGRGGSDTTASVLGVALNAEYIDIFTDVEGIMTADPRIVEDARLINDITYNEICQMAREGAKVVHPRAIEIAMQKGIPIRVRPTFSDSLGTLVRNRIDSHSDRVSIIRDTLITGITHSSNIAQIKIDVSRMEDAQGIQLKVFQAMAEAGISVDFINVQPELIMYTVADEEALRAEQILQSLKISPFIEFDCAKVAVVGAAMTGIPGVMARVVEALHQYEIPILQSGFIYQYMCLVKRTHETGGKSPT